MRQKLAISLPGFWWVPLLTGLICLGFGIWCLCSPVISIVVLADLFAAGFIIAGVLNLLFSGIVSTIMPHWGWAMALGILELIGGIWLLSVPESVLLTTFAMISGVLILVASVNSICEACTLCKYSSGWLLWMILSLIATILSAVVFLSNPIAGGIIVWMWIGISLVTFAIYRIMLAFMIRSITGSTDQTF